MQSGQVISDLRANDVLMSVVATKWIGHAASLVSASVLSREKADNSAAKPAIKRIGENELSSV